MIQIPRLSEPVNFLKSVSFKSIDALPEGYPFSIPVIEALQQLDFTSAVTFFVGENGSGKSSLMEALAVAMECPAIGRADASRDPLLTHAQKLAGHLRLAKSIKPRKRLFFRAEDAMGFTIRVSEGMDELKALEAEFDQNLSGYGRDLATGAVRGQRKAFEERYGEDPDARSHGESFLNLLKERVHGPGFFLLDEPETPLSPIHQLTLLSMLKLYVEDGCQFIIATHSPILMAFPGATILSFDHTPIRQLTWDQVEHVSLTRSFLNDPESFLRHL